MIKVDVKVNVDSKALLSDYIDAAYKAMEELMMAAYHEWQDEAGRKLHTTVRAYREAVQYKLVSPGEVNVFLQQSDDFDHWIANALERGSPTFNIRKARLSKIGNTIPPPKKRTPAQNYAIRKYLESVGRWGLPRVPYVDIPIYKGQTRESGRPTAVRRVSKHTEAMRGTWQHPGFRPLGEGGLTAPLREHVVEFIVEEAPKIFNKLLSKVSV